MKTIKSLSEGFKIEDKDLIIMSLKETIENQSRTIEGLRQEIVEVKKAAIVKEMQKENPMSDEEYICMIQLKELKGLAEQRELTLEETKKVDIYVKCLSTIRNKPKKVELSSKDLTNDELHKMLEKELSVAEA